MGSKYNLGSIVYPNLRKKLVEKGMSIRELGRQLMMPKTTIERKVCGESRIYFEEALQMSVILTGDKMNAQELLLRF